MDVKLRTELRGMSGYRVRKGHPQQLLWRRFHFYIHGPYNQVTGTQLVCSGASTPATARHRALRVLQRRWVRDLKLPRPTIAQL